MDYNAINSKKKDDCKKLLRDLCLMADYAFIKAWVSKNGSER